MSEFDDKLNALLSNPDSMAQIMQLAQSLSGNGSASGQPAQAGTGQPIPPSAPAPPPMGQPMQSGGGSLSGLLGGLDPQLIGRILPILQELNSSQDTNARRLLYALRPYLKPQRQEKVEKALQLARLLRLGRKYLFGWGG